MRIDTADSWQQYLESWSRCMRDTYWFKERCFFDYSREEETEALREEFKKGDNIFLIASDDCGDTLGTLGIRIKGERGVIRRWEPAVPLVLRDSGVGESLLEEGVRFAREQGVRRLTATLRYPHDSEKPWCGGLYNGLCFREKKPGLQLILRLNGERYEPPLNLETLPCDDFSDMGITSFVIRCFATTPEDIAVHGDDKNVSDLVSAERVIRFQRGGGLGYSPSDLRRVALVDGEPAGFIRNFIPDDPYRPRFGLIGQLGVFPEYRRRGIGISLVMDSLNTLKKKSCEYAYVGTPQSNHAAINLYEKIGFRPIFKIIFCEKNC
ncbi:MAG: GNAT family N-acetyltransferase [Candidatus Bathyarchaeota archaeon]|nr:MAG: GNAT family N-acetyltransferase [Candidatus Bathyarchaeota archaeon]